MFILVILMSFTLNAQPHEITVSAAISLKGAFEEIGRMYDRKSSTKVLFNFGASGDLARQVKAGAPVDIFASAAEKDMMELATLGLLDTTTLTNFAVNTVVLIVPTETKTTLKSFDDLKRAEVTKIAIGNPRSVPAGRYAIQAFNSFHLLPGIKDKLIYTENVQQALDYVERGEVDAGVVYSTDAAFQKGATVVASAPENSHDPVVYPIAVVKGSRNQAEAKAFVSFLLSHDGKEVLKRHGFGLTK